MAWKFLVAVFLVAPLFLRGHRYPSYKSRQGGRPHLKLAAGEYTPVLQPTNLEDFGQQLIAGRRVVGHFSPRTVLLDPTLCSLVLTQGPPSCHTTRVRAFPSPPLVLGVACGE